MPRFIFSFYLWLFFLDGTLSLADEIAQGTGVGGVFSAWRGGVAILAFLAGFPLLLILILDPRYPKRILLPAIFFLIWANACAAFPLILMEGAWVTFSLSLLQFVVGVFLIWRYLKPGSLWLEHPAFERRTFEWKNTAVTGGTVLLGGVVLIPFFLLGAAVSFIQHKTQGYVRVRADGIYLTERHFEKEKQQIRLVGMMHVGRKEFYNDLAADVSLEKGGIVLLEGVTNNKGILAPSLNYSNMAGMLGVTPQHDSDFHEMAQAGLEKQEQEAEKPVQKTEGIRYRVADVDLSDLRPETLGFINHVGRLYGSRNVREMLETYASLNAAYPDENTATRVMEDILDTRNKHLLGEIERSVGIYPVIIVPWGALHLPDIEGGVEGMGYRETFSKERKALSFW